MENLSNKGPEADRIFTFGHQEEAVKTEEGVTRKLLSYGGNVMMAEISFEKDAVGSIHTHPHEQITYVLQGSFEFNVDGKIQKVGKGDSIYIPSNAVQGVKSLEENSMLVDIFTPMREDFLK
jgi:quercetin dioxygenase-like cupin family protein